MLLIIAILGHPSVKNSHSAGAIGVMAVKKSNDGVWLHFAHNTDSFVRSRKIQSYNNRANTLAQAIASMHSAEDRPKCVMSRGKGKPSPLHSASLTTNLILAGNNTVTTGARSLGLYKSQLQDVSDQEGEGKRRKKSHGSSLGYSGYSGFSGANIGSAAGISTGGGCR